MCAFIDFQKAFDSVWRTGLCSKIVKYNINGKLLSVIKNLYKETKSYLLLNNDKSDFFACSRGVRQGENLSPILFSLYLNDLEHYVLSRNNCNISIEDIDLDIFIQILVLLYADDTVLFARSEQDLLTLLDSFIEYFETWKLGVNDEQNKNISVW